MSRFKIAAAAIALLPAAAFAQDATIVVTANRVAQDARDVGQAITVLDAATISTRQQPVVSELLATTPGITVSRTGGTGSQTSVRIRGGEAAQTLVLVDGVRVNDPSDPSGAYDFGNLLTDTIERIEILRGPNSVAWGSQAIGGVVNIMTAAPTEQLSLSARASYGDYATVDTAASAGFAIGPARLRVGGAYYTTDGVSAVASGTERDGYEHYGVSARADVAISDAVALDVRAHYARGRLAYDDAFSSPPSDNDDRSVVRQLNGYAGLTFKLLDGALRNRIAFSAADVDRSYDGSFAFTARGRTDRVEYGGDVRMAKGVRLVYGAESEWTRLRTFDAFSGEDRRSTNIWSVYAQALLQPFSGLNLTGGVRRDQHSQFGGRTTFGANAAWTIAQTTLRASYAEGFKAPTLSQLYGFGGDPSLRPETAENIDAGIEQRLLDDRVRASATYFVRRSQNLIVNDPVTFQLSNIARSYAEGLELELRLKPVDTIQLSTNYTRLRSIDRTPGSANFGHNLQYRPRDSLSASVDATLKIATIGATARLVGDSFNDRANLKQIDGYALLDLRAAVPIGNHFELYGRIENLFDAKYETVSGYGTLGRNGHIGVRVKL